MTFKMSKNFPAKSEAIKALIPLTTQLIPTADPEDLKALWNWNPAAEHGWEMPSKPGTAYGFSSLPARFHGLDVRTITYRVMWLGMLQTLSEHGAVDFPYFHDGKPDDAVFKAFALVPMTGIYQGMSTEPYDLDELKRLIENEPKA